MVSGNFLGGCVVGILRVVLVSGFLGLGVLGLLGAGSTGSTTLTATDLNLNPYTVGYDGVNIIFQRGTLSPMVMNASQFKSMLVNQFASTTTDTTQLRDIFGNATTCSYDGTNVTCTSPLSGTVQFKYSKTELLNIVSVFGI